MPISLFSVSVMGAAMLAANILYVKVVQTEEILYQTKDTFCSFSFAFSRATATSALFLSVR